MLLTYALAQKNVVVSCKANKDTIQMMGYDVYGSSKTLVNLLSRSVNNKFTDFLLLTDVCH